MKKKLIAIIIALVLVIGMLTACGDNGNNDNNNESPVQLIMSTLTYDDTTKLVTWNEIVNASSYALTITSESVNKTATIAITSKNAITNKYEYEIVEDTSGSYEVSVIAKGDNVNYLDSTAKTVTAVYTKILEPTDTMTSEKWDKIIDDTIYELTKINANYKFATSYFDPIQEIEYIITYFIDSNKAKNEIKKGETNEEIGFLEYDDSKFYLYSSNDNGLTFSKKETNPNTVEGLSTLGEAIIKSSNLNCFKGHFEDFIFINDEYKIIAIDCMSWFNATYSLEWIIKELDQNVWDSLEDKFFTFKIDNGLINEFGFFGIAGDSFFETKAVFTYGGQSVTLPEINNDTPLTQEEFDQIAATTLAYIEDESKYFGFEKDEQRIQNEEISNSKKKCFSQDDKYCFENEDGTINYYYFEGNLMHKYIQDIDGNYLYYTESPNENFRSSGRDVALQIALMASVSIPFVEFDGEKYIMKEGNFADFKQACIEAASDYFGDVHNDMLTFEVVEFSFIISNGMITAVDLIVENNIPEYPIEIIVSYLFIFDETMSIELPTEFIDKANLIEVYINGNGMSPTLNDGDAINILRTKAIDYDDIIVFSRNDIHLIKRVLGLEGDTVWAERNEETGEISVWRNRSGIEEKLIEDYLLEPIMWNINLIPLNEKITLGQGEIFVAGDNRNNSQDSFFFGAISMEDVLGKYVSMK